MIVECLNCGHKFATNLMMKDDLGKHVLCEKCGSTFDIPDIKQFSKKYVIQSLKDEYLWKIGDKDHFEVTFSKKWKLTLRREEEIYAPFKYSLEGNVAGTNETWSRRYLSMEDAFLHVVNLFNEDAAVKNKYKDIYEWLAQ